MAISVTHATQTIVADDGVSPVGSDEWNAAHTVTGAAALDAANVFTADQTIPTVIATVYALGAADFAEASGNYHVIYEPAGSIAINLGNAADPTNYYDNTAHKFRSRSAGAVFATIDSTGLAFTGTKAITGATFDSAGSGNTLKVSGVTVSRGQLPGTNTNDAATAGNVGETISSTVATGSAVSMTSGAVADITSISLTAGDWIIFGDHYINLGASTNITWAQASISTAATTMNVAAGNFATFPFGGGTVLGSTTALQLKTGPVRLSLSGTTTVYLNAAAAFSVSTAAAWGKITAVRVR